MAAPYGNANAEKWTPEIVVPLMEQINQEAIDNGHCLLIHAFNDRLTWDQYEYLLDKFKDNPVVFRVIKKLEKICEANLTSKMLKGEVKETASIFLLKCKYGYQDKQVIEHDVKGTININLQFDDVTDE